MKTNRFLTQRHHWLWVLFISGGLLIGALAHPLFTPTPVDPYAELPTIADPLFGNGGGPG
ncbi:MAG: hypothetical protein ACOYNY_28135 [Caldilineaceae bacterium]